MPRERVAFTVSQWGEIGVLIALLGVQIAAELSGGPVWLLVVVGILMAITLVHIGVWLLPMIRGSRR